MMFRCFVIVCLLLLVSRVWAEDLWAIEVSENANNVEISHDLEIIEPILEWETELKVEEWEISVEEQETQIDTDDIAVENFLPQEVSEESLDVLPVWELTKQLVEDEQEHIKNEAEAVLLEEIVQEDYNVIDQLPINTVVSDTEQRSIIVDWDKVIVMWK